MFRPFVACTRDMPAKMPREILNAGAARRRRARVPACSLATPRHELVTSMRAWLDSTAHTLRSARKGILGCPRGPLQGERLRIAQRPCAPRSRARAFTVVRL